VKDDADVIIGTSVNEAFQNEIQITVIATGFTEKPQGVFSSQQMSAAEYFQGKSTSTETSFSNSSFSLDVPDFLRKN
jgi:cell division GTPase FtsZ